MGACVYVYDTPKKLMFPDLAFRMHVLDDVNPIYLVALLNDSPLSGDVRGLAHGTAKSMSNIPKTGLAKLRVPLPPIELQLEFANFVQQIDKSRVALQQALDDLNAMMTAILNEELSA